MVTASRAISLATSSRCAESCSLTARASRIRHSSSLIADMSLGTIEGTDLMRSVWLSGIESPLGETRHHEISPANKSFWGSAGGSKGVPGARISASTRLPFTSKAQQNHCRAGGFPSFLMRRDRKAFRPLQAPEALLYAARVRTIVSPYSSVAQR